MTSTQWNGFWSKWRDQHSLLRCPGGKCPGGCGVGAQRELHGLIEVRVDAPTTCPDCGKVHAAHVRCE